MQYGWASENELNKRVYKTWLHMLERCYSEKYHKRQPSYVGCLVCDDWLTLSNFVRDFKLIDGYDEEKFLSGELCLDKDIKSNGVNKKYSLENCMLVSKTENVKQAMKTKDNGYLHNRTGENHHRSIKIVQYDKQNNFIKVWDSSYEIQRETGIKQSSIITCCKWYLCGENLEEWYKVHKRNPLKSAGGFIFKYYEEDNKNE